MNIYLGHKNETEQNYYDISANVQETTYKVDKTAAFKPWTDARGNTHRSIYNYTYKGSFDLVFLSIEELRAFVTKVTEYTSGATGRTELTFYVTNTGEEMTFNVFLTFSSSKFTDIKNGKQYIRIKCEVEG